MVFLILFAETVLYILFYCFLVILILCNIEQVTLYYKSKAVPVSKHLVMRAYEWHGDKAPCTLDF